MGVEQELGAELRRHERALRALVMAALREGVPFATVQRRIRRYLSDGAVAESLRERLVAEAERQFTWIDRRTMGAADRQRAREALAVADGFATVEQAIDEALRQEVLRAIDETVPRRELEGRLARALKMGRHRAFTVGNTAFGGFDRADFWRNAEQAAGDAATGDAATGDADASAGETMYFRYAGPPADRAFCRTHLGGVYTRTEINSLDNGQGLDVALYMGGYNCRHRWVLATDAEVAEREAEQEAVVGSDVGEG